ncbi:YjcZ-like family protein [Mangrovibacter yixingensis]|uniref:YjcZ-like family protein n=1 Tax=Mangrovibacter yixingensis TaxID=1529639 RepID=UPI001CFD0939|nr:YjcZ-like family protein [Mangrovibacter yixingensis]
MTYSSIAGLGERLECINGKFVVDLASDLNLRRERYRHPQSKQFWAHLQSVFRQKLPAGQVLHGSEAAMDHGDANLAWLQWFISKMALSQFALSSLAARVQVLRASCPPDNERETHLVQLQSLISQRQQRLAVQLKKSDNLSQAQVHCEQVFTRWRTGHYQRFSPASRCYIALEELRWGMFGDVYRAHEAIHSRQLVDVVRERAIAQLASDIGASAQTRHFYHQWLTFPPATGMVDLKALLSWLGDWSHGEYQPVTWSVTQSWQNIALGMPRICSASRLAGSMVDEVFHQAEDD